MRKAYASPGLLITGTVIQETRQGGLGPPEAVNPLIYRLAIGGRTGFYL
jgi:hypothetical protein